MGLAPGVSGAAGPLQTSTLEERPETEAPREGKAAVSDLIVSLFYPFSAAGHFIWLWHNCPEEYEDDRLPIALVGGIIWPVIFMLAIFNGYRVLSVDAERVTMKGEP